ncbi:lactate dehydrogenase [Sedimentibacter sp. MB31-C6]|uniref:lactate dehydrogenase n=1 Tax=Sedimentibacter sp. MB31-C6 TaxID=3109366 RepID=UPI002DDDAF36|nr:lactate dehydrogenase [Sedimentibacter sp. MB36-C1]WSI04694.1 lactate dehydrogenase [Sedimentibacter sp. MB36-C1]
MFYYKYKDKYLLSLKDKYSMEKANESEVFSNCNEIYFLTKLGKNKSKRTFAVTHESDLLIDEENLEVLKLKDINLDIPKDIKILIKEKKIKAVNTEFDDFEKSFFVGEKRKKRINILALGDVGSTLLIGLKLLGGNCIESIGIFDRSSDKIKRWEYEMNQTCLPIDYEVLPLVHGIKKDELFDCDMFVFCASKGVPPVGSEISDVRMVQFEENSKLIKEYAVMAAESNFKGIFSVVSDPVDLLCNSVLMASKGKLAPEQIKGYGLGVMNARAAYYARSNNKYSQYLLEGRAYGPHGNELVIADSITNYNDIISKELTKLTVEANLKVRKTGFKPFVAPALSSGAISIISTLEGKWHYSSNYIGGVYMGSKNRNLPIGLEIEKINMPEELYNRIEKTYNSQLKMQNNCY